MRRFLLLFPDPAEGETAPPTPPTPQGDPPPAAKLVVESGVQEGDAAETLRLKRENAELARKLKLRETEVSEKEDALRRLTTPPPTPPAPATPPDEEEDDRWTIMG